MSYYLIYNAGYASLDVRS